MQNLLFLILITCGTFSYACPSLKGSYDCKSVSHGGVWPSHIDQHINSAGATVYDRDDASSTPIVADGISRSEEFDSGTFTVTSWCEDKILYVQYLVEFPGAAPAKSTFKTYKNTTGQLVDELFEKDDYQVMALCTPI